MEPTSAGRSWRWKSVSFTAGVVVLAITMTMLVIGFHSHPLSTKPSVLQEFINKESVPRCIECYTDQCSLDYKTWSSCPQSHPYYSDVHGACVRSEQECSAASAVTRSFGNSLCAHCSENRCFVGHRYLKCGSETPFYEITINVCVNSCSAPPGPPPPPAALFDCDSADYPNWERAWSDKKKQWCCDNKSNGCHKDEICPQAGGHVCQSDTGETCNLFDCGAAQGEAHCKWKGWFAGHKCICKQGACLHSMTPGKCVEVGCCFHMRDGKCSSTYITSKEECYESLGELMTVHPDIQGGFSPTCPASVADGIKLLSN